jgi:hypothetical protein
MSLTEDSAWYIPRNGEQIGPLSRTQLQDYFEAGKLARSDDLWSAELGDWKPASTLFDFSGVLQPPPPPRRDQPIAEPKRSTSTRTVIEGGSFKFGTLVWIVLAFLIPLWPISLPICLFCAYRSYKKPTIQTVRTVSE